MPECCDGGPKVMDVGTLMHKATGNNRQESAVRSHDESTRIYGTLHF
jgi:hypothetical protein